ncbi:MAG: DUF882 domain-containing protein [Alphaproteobacteria bacterium]
MKPVILVLLLLMTGCAGYEWGGRAPAERRFISLRVPETGETAAVTYINDWHYDRAALRQIAHICRDRHNGAVGKIDPRLIDFIADLRDRVGLPESTTLDVLSCYRAPETNAALARTDRYVARESWHTKGRAVDLRVPQLTGRAMAEVAKTMQRGGVAYYPRSGHVHIDTGEVRTWKVR